MQRADLQTQRDSHGSMQTKAKSVVSDFDTGRPFMFRYAWLSNSWTSILSITQAPNGKLTFLTVGRFRSS